MKTIKNREWIVFVFQKIFRFEKWHCATIREREYIEFVVKYIDCLIDEEAIQGMIVEIGGGLGDVIASIDYPKRKKILYDSDSRVIHAGSLLHPGIRMNTGSFEDIEKMTIDVLITVNFLFSIENKVLEKILESFLADNIVNYWILDDVQSPPYAVQHDFIAVLKRYGFGLVDKSKGYRAAKNSRRHILVFKKNYGETKR